MAPRSSFHNLALRRILDEYLYGPISDYLKLAKMPRYEMLQDLDNTEDCQKKEVCEGAFLFKTIMCFSQNKGNGSEFLEVLAHTDNSKAKGDT